MTKHRVHARLPGKLVLIGFGAVGQGALPLLLRHLDVPRSRVMIITADDRGAAEAARFEVSFTIRRLTPSNYRTVLEPLLAPGDFLLNVSVDVSSVDLIALCQARGVMYLDTCIEPWAGGYTDTRLSASRRSNYALREAALEAGRRTANGPTAILTHGANPGLISHFVKRALLDIARGTGFEAAAPRSRDDWAALGMRLGVKVIHVAERDTQRSVPPKAGGEFVNTWSVDGFVGEGLQPAELGWGTHEKTLPADGRRHEFGPGCAIYLDRPGASVRVRTWTPVEGPFHGFLVTHGESISIADYLSVRRGDGVVYRPTVHYAYHPCDGAIASLHELAGKNWRLGCWRVLMDDIVDGSDELGALLMGHARGAYWFGSRLSIEAARALAPHNNATSLQVAAGVLGAVVWALENPQRGVVEPEQMDFERVLEVASPYLGELAGAWSDWTPLAERGRLFAEAIDAGDPWQFGNFRVA